MDYIQNALDEAGIYVDPYSGLGNPGSQPAGGALPFMAYPMNTFGYFGSNGTGRVRIMEGDGQGDGGDWVRAYGRA